MIVAVAQAPKMDEYAKSKGAKGIQLSGICCTANEMLQRHGVPLCGTFLQQELAIITGACDAMEGLLTPESAKVFCGPGLTEVCETVGIPPVLHDINFTILRELT